MVYNPQPAGYVHSGALGTAWLVFVIVFEIAFFAILGLSLRLFWINHNDGRKALRSSKVGSSKRNLCLPVKESVPLTIAFASFFRVLRFPEWRVLGGYLQGGCCLSVSLESGPQICMIFAVVQIIGLWKVVLDASKGMKKSDGHLTGSFARKLLGSQVFLVGVTVPSLLLADGVKELEDLITVVDGVLGLYLLALLAAGVKTSFSLMNVLKRSSASDASNKALLKVNFCIRWLTIDGCVLLPTICAMIVFQEPNSPHLLFRFLLHTCECGGCLICLFAVRSQNKNLKNSIIASTVNKSTNKVQPSTMRSMTASKTQK